MDTFIEQIIKKKKEPIDWFIIIGIFWLAAVIAWAVLSFISFLLPSLVLVFWGAWWVATNRNIEFEYSFTNGVMDIDTIIAQRRRKRLCSITCEKVEVFGELAKANLEGRRFDRVIMAAPKRQMEGNYYFIYRSKKYGNTMVIFHPDDRVRSAFCGALPRLMQIQLEKEAKKQG